jgi:beta-N-acetylhexosaminidase
VDHEGGNVNRFLPGVAALPAASSYWALSLERGRKEALTKIEEDSLRVGIEINELGINLNFAPVAEFLYDGNCDFLASRSYGPDPSFISDAASAFVHAMEQSGVLCVVKHFPASAGADPHYSASLLDLSKTVLDGLVSPFASLFENGARAVMIAHTAVPAIDSKIASLSSVVMKDWLRDELGFDGIIICDDFSMAAAGIQSAEEAAVQSIAAGADMVLVWPPDLIRTYRAILSALEDGRLSRERLTDAAERIIYEKIRMKLTDGE